MAKTRRRRRPSEKYLITIVNATVRFINERREAGLVAALSRRGLRPGYVAGEGRREGLKRYRTTIATHWPAVVTVKYAAKQALAWVF